MLDENLKETAFYCLDMGLQCLPPDGYFEPFAFIFDEADGDRIQQFLSPDGDTLAFARRSISALPGTVTSYVLVRDAYLTIGPGERTPTVLVEIGIRGEAEAQCFGIRYRFDEETGIATSAGNPMHLGSCPHLRQ